MASNENSIIDRTYLRANESKQKILISSAKILCFFLFQHRLRKIVCETLNSLNTKAPKLTSTNLSLNSKKITIFSDLL